MPYKWECASDGTQSITLWRFRSLTPQGFAWVMGGAAVALVLPLIATLGYVAMWGLLPFAVLALGALWWGVQAGWTNGGTQERVTLTRDQITVVRRDPGRPVREWQSNPYWVRAALRRDGPVEDYLTLSDGKRVIELGAFLTPEERRSLAAELTEAIEALRQPSR